MGIFDVEENMEYGRLVAWYQNHMVVSRPSWTLTTTEDESQREYSDFFAEFKFIDPDNNSIEITTDGIPEKYKYLLPYNVSICAKRVGKVTLRLLDSIHHYSISDSIIDRLELSQEKTSDDSYDENIICLKNCRIGNLQELIDFAKDADHVILQVDNKTVSRSKVTPHSYDSLGNELYVGDEVFAPAARTSFTFQRYGHSVHLTKVTKVRMYEVDTMFKKNRYAPSLLKYDPVMIKQGDPVVGDAVLINVRYGPNDGKLLVSKIKSISSSGKITVHHKGFRYEKYEVVVLDSNWVAKQNRLSIIVDDACRLGDVGMMD